MIRIPITHPNEFDEAYNDIVQHAEISYWDDDGVAEQKFDRVAKELLNMTVVRVRNKGVILEFEKDEDATIFLLRYKR